MRWLRITIFSIFIMLLLPSDNQAAIVYTNETLIQQEVNAPYQKVEKPRKKFRKWLRNHKGLLFFGGMFLIGLTMFVLGLVYHTKWLWITGLFTIIAPWILVVIILLITFIFRPRPRPPIIQETPTPKKEKSTK